MLKKRIAATVMALAMLVSTFAFTSCSDGEDKTIGNAYVSVYAYNDKGRSFLKEKAVKVTPNENHEYEWGKINTAYLALETVCAKDNKNKALSLITDTTGGVTIDKIDSYQAGVNSEGDPFFWQLYINGKLVEDAEKYELQNYDKLEFKFVEQTYRSINVTVSAKNSVSATTVLDSSTLTAAGEKDELTVANVLKYAAPKEKSNMERLGITLSEDGTAIAKIGDVEANDKYQWAVIAIEASAEGTVMETVIKENIAEYVLENGDEIRFEYREIEENAETGAAEAETSADE